MVDKMRPALLSTSDAAETLGLSVKAVRAAVHRGEIGAVRVGGDMFFRREEVAAFIERLPAWPTAVGR